jgi:hypothetical protein
MILDAILEVIGFALVTFVVPLILITLFSAIIGE